MSRARGTLGIDPGSQVTGFCVLIAGYPAESGIITLNHKWTFEDRRKELRDAVTKLLQRVRKYVEVVAIEDPPMMHNVSILKKLVTLKTMIEEIACQAGVPYISVGPTEWQALVRIAAGKPMPVMPIKALSIQTAALALKKQPESNDEADAYWIARYAHENVIVQTT